MSSLTSATETPISSGTTDAVLGRVNRALAHLESLVAAQSPTEHVRPKASTDQDQRSDRRTSLTTSFTVVFEERSAESGSTLRFVHGQTVNLSDIGVGFVTPTEVSLGKHLVLMRHPEFRFPHCCFEATVLWTRRHESGDWEHGALLRPLSAMTPASFFGF